MYKNSLKKWSIIITLIVGGYIVWKTMPEHKRTFWRNFIRQVPDLPARYMV